MSTNRNNKKSTSWGIIILLIIIFWPVGLYLLYKKVTGDKESALQNSKIFNIIGWIFLVLAVMYFILGITGELDIEEGSSLVGSLCMSLIFFGGGGLLMLRASKKMRTIATKYKKYIAIVINNNQTSIDNIAAAIPTEYEQAKTVLQEMIDKGYFVNAYIDDTKREIVLPHQQSLDENQKDIDVTNIPLLKTVVCNNCGGNNKVVDGQVCECEFCGSLLK